MSAVATGQVPSWWNFVTSPSNLALWPSKAPWIMEYAVNVVPKNAATPPMAVTIAASAVTIPSVSRAHTTSAAANRRTAPAIATQKFLTAW